eukprot:6171936-Pleurochrysis_carterae.AAC.1
MALLLSIDNGVGVVCGNPSSLNSARSHDFGFVGGQSDAPLFLERPGNSGTSVCEDPARSGVTRCPIGIGVTAHSART